MSESGQKRRFFRQPATSGLLPKADIDLPMNSRRNRGNRTWDP